MDPSKGLFSYQRTLKAKRSNHFSLQIITSLRNRPLKSSIIPTKYRVVVLLIVDTRFKD